MRELTGSTRIRVRAPRKTPARKPLTGDTRIRLSQIKGLKEWVTDRRKYKIGEISEKTGLLKTRTKSGKIEWVEPSTKGQTKTSWHVPHSLGAAAKVYTAKEDTPVRKGHKKEWTLKQGSEVTDISLIARGHGIKTVATLIKNHKRPNGTSTKATDWTKKKGFGTVVGRDGKERKAELHWYECQGMGKIDFKVKKWKDER